MKHSLLFLIVVYLLSFRSSLHVRKLIPSSTLAIRRIKERVHFLEKDTSCKVAAKFILLAICDIKNKEQLPILKLTHDYKKDLQAIKDKLIDGYVLQIEIKSNHHFVIFKKNNSEMYLLQAFQDRFRLIEWLNNKEIMKPYLTIDEFFRRMKTMLNPNISRQVFEQTIIELFLPPIFTTDKKLIKRTLSYFNNNHAKLIKVNYALFNFSNKYKGKAFDKLFNYVDKHYRILLMA